MMKSQTSTNSNCACQKAKTFCKMFVNNKMCFTRTKTNCRIYFLLYTVLTTVFFPSLVRCHKDKPIAVIPEQTMTAQFEEYQAMNENATYKDSNYFWEGLSQDPQTQYYSDDNAYAYEYESMNLNQLENESEDIEIIDPLSVHKTAEEPTGCPRGRICNSPADESRLLAIEKLKERILERLNMASPPNITIPKVSFDSPPMKTLLRKHGYKVDRTDPSKVEEDTAEDLKEERVVSMAKPVPIPSLEGLYFKFTAYELEQTVKNALLWIYILPNPTKDTKMTIKLSRYQRNSIGDIELVHFDTKVIKILPLSDEGAWRKFHVHHVVSGWFRANETNLGIVVSSPNHPELLTFGETNETEKYKPIVDVDLVSNIAKRTKRFICTEDSSESRCCKYNFLLNFDDIQWNFVIAPKVFNMYYCSGDCPFVLLKAGFKKLLVHYTTTAGRRSEGAQGCCSPVKMKPLSLLYFDNNQNVIFSKLPDMIVEECGCL